MAENETYQDGFIDTYDGKAGWAAVQSEFQMDEPEPDEVYFALYDLSQAYEGSADVFYRRGERFFYATGGHCSCYGLEGQWEPEEYTREQLLGQVERANWGFFKDKADLIRQAVA
jgi:hypothetical protein